MLHGLDPLLRFSHVESAWLFHFTIAWFLAWGGHAVVAHVRRDDPWFRPWPWHRILGVVLVLWPFVQFGYSIYLSIDTVLDRGSVAPTVSAAQWWLIIERRIWQYVVLPLTGLFLAFGYHQRLGLWPPVHMRLRELFERTLIWPRHSLMRDLANGAWLFVLVYFGYIMLHYLLAPLRQYDTGDASATFTAITPALALALALMAGVTEELLFRGILQTQLRRVMPLGVAVLLQALFFGFIHAGYGTLSQLVFPTLFGIAMGLLVLRFGLLPAIMVHAGVNFIIFLGTLHRIGYRGALDVASLVLVVALAFAAAYYTSVLVRHLRHRATGDEAASDGPDSADAAPVETPSTTPGASHRSAPLDARRNS